MVSTVNIIIIFIICLEYNILTPVCTTFNIFKELVLYIFQLFFCDILLKHFTHDTL